IPVPSQLLMRFASSLSIVACLALTGSSACFPTMMHGARVEDGAAVGITAATTSGPAHVEGDEGGIRLRQGMIGLYTGYGWAAATSHQPGFYLGATVPVFFPAAQIDAYMQMPPAWTGSYSAGVGTTADFLGATGYAQFGQQNERGSGWS